MDTIYAHIIEEGGDRIGAQKLISVPRVGDEIRWQENVYFRVTRVVYCMDERGPEWSQRVNIGIERIVT